MTAALTREQAQAAVTAAATERDTIQANLLDADGSFGKRLLAGATLSGESRALWESASAGLASLWETFSAYSAVIDHAAEILAPTGRLPAAKLAEVSALLTGASVRLARAEQPLRQRELTAGADMWLTLAATVLQMRRAFADLAAVLTAAEAVWNETSEGLRQVSDSLDAAQLQAPDLADAELASALALSCASLRQLRESLNADPLALWRGGRVDTGRLDRLAAQAAAVTARVTELARVRDEADLRITEVSATISAARQAWQDAMAAREHAATRVDASNLGLLPDVSGLAGRLSELTGLRTTGRWIRLQSELDLVGKQAGAALRLCREAEGAAAGLLEQRDELRGLLDAYRAKAGQLGAAENADLDAQYRQAHDLLWTAPCDLVAATAAVTGYQRAVLLLRRNGERK